MSDKKEMPHFTLEVVKWEGKLHCCYLNNFRIAGSKPWAGGETVKSWPVPLRDLVQAIPELRKTAEERDAAQSQLAALREERTRLDASLSCMSGHVLAYKLSRQRLLGRARTRELHISELQQRLADAERRNGELLHLLECAREDWIPKDAYGDTIEQIDAALNPNPEAASHDE